MTHASAITSNILCVLEMRLVLKGGGCEAELPRTIRRRQNVLSLLRFLLWTQPLTPRVQPAFVYQNRAKGVHGVLERVCFATERESEKERERERERERQTERESMESIVQQPVTVV